MATPYRKLDIRTAFSFDETLERDGSVYVSRLSTPVIISTNPVQLRDDITDDSRFALLQIDDSLISFFKEVEERVVQECLKNKAINVWFREDILDEDIISRAKSFLTDNLIKVKLGENVECFDRCKNPVDAPPQGSTVRVVLEASRITFGRTEFGLIWTLRQMKLVEPCLLDDECGPDDDGAAVLPQEHASILVHDSEGLDDSIA